MPPPHHTTHLRSLLPSLDFCGRCSPHLPATARCHSRCVTGLLPYFCWCTAIDYILRIRVSVGGFPYDWFSGLRRLRRSPPAILGHLRTFSAGCHAYTVCATHRSPPPALLPPGGVRRRLPSTFPTVVHTACCCRSHRCRSRHCSPAARSCVFTAGATCRATTLPSPAPFWIPAAPSSPVSGGRHTAAWIFRTFLHAISSLPGTAYTCYGCRYGLCLHAAACTPRSPPRMVHHLPPAAHCRHLPCCLGWVVCSAPPCAYCRHLFGFSATACRFHGLVYHCGLPASARSLDFTAVSCLLSHMPAPAR